MQNTEYQLTWQTGDGRTVVVVALGHGNYEVTVAGERLGRTHGIQPLPSARQFDGLRRQHIVAMMMIDGKVVALTAERRNTLLNLNEQATAAYVPTARELLLRAEVTLLDAQDRLTRHGYGSTGVNGRAVEQAQAALHTVIEQHPDEWAAIQAERKAEAERKAAEVRDSFVMRGLD